MAHECSKNPLFNENFFEIISGISLSHEQTKGEDGTIKWRLVFSSIKMRLTLRSAYIVHKLTNISRFLDIASPCMTLLAMQKSQKNINKIRFN